MFRKSGVTSHTTTSYHNHVRQVATSTCMCAECALLVTSVVCQPKKTGALCIYLSAVRRSRCQSVQAVRRPMCFSHLVLVLGSTFNVLRLALFLLSSSFPAELCLKIIRSLHALVYGRKREDSVFSRLSCSSLFLYHLSRFFLFFHCGYPNFSPHKQSYHFSRSRYEA